MDGRSRLPGPVNLLHALCWMAAVVCLSLGTAAAQQDPQPEPREDVRELEQAAIRASVAEVADSVVRIETLGGLQQIDGSPVNVGPTTGLIVSPDGLIVSSAFGFVHQPTSILVTLPDGQRAAAEIVARDHSRMLVLLKANVEQPLAVAEPVPRDEMAVGQWTIAVGRTYSLEEPNVSVGVMSATTRIWGKAVQTDAKISPSNYGGPLVDIRGRVLGVLVPLSPQASETMAGAEWYDSGIGFAVPLVDVLARLDTWKQGQDLHPGVLGVALKGKNDMLDEAVIGVVRVNSPAAAAGLKPGDKIVSAGGVPVSRIAELKHVLGPLYAGDSLSLEVQRQEQRIAAAIVLVDKLVPYAHPFLGILPRRGAAADPAGITVRWVYPDSPAAAAGLEPGDRLTTWNGQPITNPSETLTLAAQQTAGESITIGWTRGDQTFEKSVTLAGQPTTVPETLPEARPAAEQFEGERPAVGQMEVKIAEEPHACSAWVPETYDPRAAYGLVVWLHASGQADAAAAITAWKELCAKHDLILLAPQGINQQWRPIDVAFVRKTIDFMQNNYRIDPQRIVVHGEEVGGALAYLTAFEHRELVRGVAPVEVALPARLSVPDNEPLQRLAILTTLTSGSRTADVQRQGIESLRALEYPVTVIERTSGGALNDEQRALVARWIDTLDRL